MLIIFVVLAGICITCGTVFVVREIEVEDQTVMSANPLSDDEKNALIEKCGLNGKSILFNLNQDKIATNVKAVNPMFKLQNVVAKFPNHVTLVISRRVPKFVDNNHVYDAEMCIVGSGMDADLVNISTVNLRLKDGLNAGDLAVGADDATNCKIEQLKVVADYFQSLEGFEISYDDTVGEIGSGKCLCLWLKIKADVTFKIKIGLHDNFRHALDYTYHVYTDADKANQVAGVYETLYQENSHENCVTNVGGVKNYREE